MNIKENNKTPRKWKFSALPTYHSPSPKIPRNEHNVNQDIVLKEFLALVKDQKTKLAMQADILLKQEVKMTEMVVSLVSQQDLLLTQQVLLGRMGDRVFGQTRNVDIFPLETMEDVAHADEKAEKILRDDLISHIKSILGRAKNHQTIQCLLSKEVLLQCNWDGAKNLFKLSSLKHFNTHVFEAVRCERIGFDEFENAMKKAVHLGKQRIYKANFRNKN